MKHSEAAIPKMGMAIKTQCDYTFLFLFIYSTNAEGL